MATISKENIAQFWLNSFPISSNYECLSFMDSNVVQNLLEFVPEKDDEKKIFDIINNYIHETKSRKILKTVPINISSKRHRSERNILTYIEPNHLRFSVHIEVIENIDYDEEISTTADENTEGIVKHYNNMFKNLSFNIKSNIAYFHCILPKYQFISFPILEENFTSKFTVHYYNDPIKHNLGF